MKRDEKAPHAKKFQNLLEKICIENGIIHKFIRPGTPEHNGKVERSHWIDQDKFYRRLKFYSLEDLKKQGKIWNKKYNNKPKILLKCKTPNEIDIELKNEFLKIRNKRGQNSPASFES